MEEPGDPIDWRQLREFTGVDLDRSYLLSWRVDGDTLRIDVDLCLAPEHPFYERPRPAEQVCLRPAVIEFPYCASVAIGGERGCRPTGAALASLGVGAISGLRRFDEGPFEISGDFGIVRIDAERPILRLRDA